MAELKPARWFLPETPDLLGALSEQATVTCEGMEAFSAWAAGDRAKADVVREAEHRADDVKRALRETLRTAFLSPIDPEDLFQLSAGLDSVLNGAKDTVREAEVIAMAPDAAMADMAAELAAGVRHLAVAFARLGPGPEDATEAADAAVRSQRRLERVYRQAMSSLLQVPDLREVMGRRELYRRLSRISENVESVAERVWYAVVKEA
jgi:hypothetical protein